MKTVYPTNIEAQFAEGGGGGGYMMFIIMFKISYESSA